MNEDIDFQLFASLNIWYDAHMSFWIFIAFSASSVNFEHVRKSA